MSAAPRLEMLWEPDDPSRTLSTRFGFTGADDVAAWVERLVAERWRIDVEACHRVVMSHTNALAWLLTERGPLVLKWSVDADRFDRLAALAELTGWLADRGHPVVAGNLSGDRGRQVEVDGVSAALLPVIDGDLLDVDDPHQVRAAGIAAARLHVALGEYPRRLPVPTARPLRTRVTTWLASCPPQVPEPVRRRLTDLVDRLPATTADHQLVHRDLRSANLLMRHGGVVAILDFEEAAIDHPLLELARSSVLLGTRFHDWAPVSTDVQRRYFEGYAGERPLAPGEQDLWRTLVLWCTAAMIPDGADPTGWAAACELAMPDGG